MLQKGLVGGKGGGVAGWHCLLQKEDVSVENQPVTEWLSVPLQCCILNLLNTSGRAYLIQKLCILIRPHSQTKQQQHTPFFFFRVSLKRLEQNAVTQIQLKVF